MPAVFVEVRPEHRSSVSQDCKGPARLGCQHRCITEGAPELMKLLSQAWWIAEEVGDAEGIARTYPNPPAHWQRAGAGRPGRRPGGQQRARQLGQEVVLEPPPQFTSLAPVISGCGGSASS
jgi:hypothetical protein